MEEKIESLEILCNLPVAAAVKDSACMQERHEFQQPTYVFPSPRHITKNVRGPWWG